LSFYVQEADGCLGSKASVRQAGGKKIWKLDFLTAPVVLLSKVGVLEEGERRNREDYYFLKKKKKNCRGEKEGAGGREGRRERRNE
jgi:hypothetical protein